MHTVGQYCMISVIAGDSILLIKVRNWQSSISIAPVLALNLVTVSGVKSGMYCKKSKWVISWQYILVGELFAL